MVTLLNVWFENKKNEIIENLKNFIDINTVSPNEENCTIFIENYLNKLGFNHKKVFFNQEMKNHFYYTENTFSELDFNNRYNIQAELIDDSKNEFVLFNAHLDVVPATSSFPQAFCSIFRNDLIIGRGACDTKNNVIMLFEAISFIKESNLKLRKNIIIDLVIEEEIGGNGTLAMVLQQTKKCSEVIVLEPTDLQLYCGHRGCLTFEIVVKGKPVHMGSDSVGINAIEEAFQVIIELKKLETLLLEEAKFDDYFNIWERPLQINIGIINGGEWTGSVPEKCIIRGDVGFLPKYTIETIKEKIENALVKLENEWVRNNLQINYNGLKNDAYIVERNTPFITNFLEIINKNNVIQNKAYGWKVSCDARLYYKILNVPTIIFGSGSLDCAHSNNEKININEIKKGIKILVDYLTI